MFFSSLSDAHFALQVTFAIVSSDFDFELFEWYGELAWIVSAWNALCAEVPAKSMHVLPRSFVTRIAAVS